MNILVCISNVPDTTTKITFTDNNTQFNTKPTIRKALAIGADDAVRIHAKPHDAWFVAYQIAQYIKQNPFDLVLTGRESIDYNGSKVAGMLGELLDLPSVSIIKKLDIDGSTATVEREIEGGKEVLTIPLPFVAGTAEGVAEPKIPNMRGIMSARTKPLTLVEAVSVDLFTELVNYETPVPRGK